MSERSIVALTVGGAVVLALYFGGHHVWNALLVMHGYKPH